MAAFGITGVGATELVAYPYWCLEKGYARYSGPRDGSPAWRDRAGGWIRVMGVDVGNSMVIYTFATVAFYFLGAGILHGRGLLPQGAEMVRVLSTMYTETMGAWSLPLFLVGAFAVLYSTIFAATAAHSRVFADFAGILKLYDKTDYAKRLQVTRLFVVILLFVALPLFHVSAGAGDDGHHRWSGPGHHAACDCLLHGLPALPSHAARGPSRRVGDPGAVDFRPGHGPCNGLFLHSANRGLEVDSPMVRFQIQLTQAAAKGFPESVRSKGRLSADETAKTCRPPDK